jgi:acylphosphatase
MLEGRRLGLSGWVRNLPGGTVELWAEGSKAALDDFLLWLRHGPPGARVDFFTFDMTSPTGSYREFEILC